MQLSPIKRQTKGTARQLTFDQLQILDVDDSFVLGILHVEVRRRMVFKKHLNDEAVKSANCWHCFLLQFHRAKLRFYMNHYIPSLGVVKRFLLPDPKSLGCTSTPYQACHAPIHWAAKASYPASCVLLLSVGRIRPESYRGGAWRPAKTPAA